MNRTISMLSVLAICALAARADAGDKKKVTVGGLEVEVDEGDSDDADSVQVGSKSDQLVIADNGHKVVHTCEPGKPLVISVLGNANQVHLKGECKTVNVAGNSNKVWIEAAGEIIATGNELTIFYKRGLDGRPPKLTKVGTNVAITKLEK